MEKSGLNLIQSFCFVRSRHDLQILLVVRKPQTCIKSANNGEIPSVRLFKTNGFLLNANTSGNTD
jgi:hypothetical protein